jgi:hypothetical protein
MLPSDKAYFEGFKVYHINSFIHTLGTRPSPPGRWKEYSIRNVPCFFFSSSLGENRINIWRKYPQKSYKCALILEKNSTLHGYLKEK